MDLFDLIPEINRGRGYRLYGGGRRFLDFYQEGGKAIIGCRQKGLGSTLKNEVDKGFFSPLPSKYYRRLCRALRTLFGQNFHIYLFGSMKTASAELERNQIEFHIWKPFERDSWDIFPVFIPLLPFPGDFSPAPVLSAFELPLKGEAVSPVLLAGAVRVVWNLREFLETADYSVWKNPLFLEAAASIWKVEIPYLYPRVSEEAYSLIFRSFLDEGMILSPFFDIPSLLPAEISDGEFKKTIKQCKIAAEILNG